MSIYNELQYELTDIIMSWQSNIPRNNPDTLFIQGGFFN